MTAVWTGRDPDIARVYCGGCGRYLGVAPTFRRAFRMMYCDEMCWHRPKVYDIENIARDRQIRLIYLCTGLSQPPIAAAFGVSRSRVQQILAVSETDYLLDQPSLMTDEGRASLARAGAAGGAARWQDRKSVV